MSDPAPELGEPSRTNAAATASHNSAARRPVAVIGGGYAGLAAALTLTSVGIPVTVFEQGHTLGGRARRVEFDGLALDNGQHLLIGAYAELQRLLALVHGDGVVASRFDRLPLTLAPFGARQAAARRSIEERGTSAPPAVALRAWRLPAPLHVALGLLTARGLGWRDKLALAADMQRLKRAGYRCPPEQTVADCFAATPAGARAALWDPLCLAALNTLPERASAQMFATVLGLSLGRGARASDFLIPRCDLSALFAEPAAAAITAAGGRIRTGLSVRRVVPGTPAQVATRNGPAEDFAAVIVAVGPHQLATIEVADDDRGAPTTAATTATMATTATSACERTTLATAWRSAWVTIQAQVAAFTYESITTIYLVYPRLPPLPAPIMRLDDRPGQWVFDRSDALTGNAIRAGQTLLAVVISGSGPHDATPQVELAMQVDAQLRRLDPRLPGVLWRRVIAERRATYACAPGLVRPAAGRLAPGLYLAGDYTDPALPPTLEAAVRSGVAAAQAVTADLARPAFAA